MLNDWGFPATYQVVVFVNELVTNAVVHAAGTIMLSLDLRSEAVRIVVSDNGGGIPHHSRRRPAAEGSRGLSLVSGMSADWGVRQRERGKTVWADVAEQVLCVGRPPHRAGLGCDGAQGRRAVSGGPSGCV